MAQTIPPSRPCALLPWCAALVMLTGCADLDDYENAQCGNNVVEEDAGEDCDLVGDPALGEDLACGPPDGTARACRYSCEGASCPDGWACGDDGLCRPPSGLFDEASEPALVLGAQEIALRDVMGDESVEVLARLQGDVFVFADDDDRLVEALAVSLPHVRGPLGFAELGEESGTGLVVPAASHPFAADGDPRVHLLRSEGERWVSATAPRRAQPEALVGVVALQTGPQHADALLRVAQPEGGKLRVSPVPTLGCPAPPATANLLLSAPLDSTPVLTAVDVTGSERGWVSVAHAGSRRVTVIEGERVCGPEVCGQSAAASACSVSLSAAQTLDTRSSISPRGCIFADFDADGQLDLACSLEDGGLDIAYGDNLLLQPFGDAVSDDSALSERPQTQSRSCASTDALLAVGDLNGDGHADVVTPHGIFVGSSEGFGRAYTRTLGDAWGDVVIGDFDRDGAVEVAATVLQASSDCTPVLLEVLSPTGAAYNSVLVPNASLPARLRAGDFDGDGIADIAAVERSEGEARVVVFFGDTKEPLEDKASVRGFDDVTALASLRWSEGTEINADLIGDLAVVSEDGGAVTLLRGTTRRAMLSPIEFDADASTAGHPISALAGHLLPGPPPADDNQDPSDLLTLVPPAAWLVPGEELSAPKAASVLDIGSTDLDPQCALWSAGSIRNEDAGPVLVGLDGASPRLFDTADTCRGSAAPHVLLAHLTGTPDATVFEASSTASVAGVGAPTAAEVVDIDNSGFDDVLVHFSASGDDRVGSLRWLQDPAVVPGLPPPAFVDATPDHDVWAFVSLNANRDAGPELALLTTTGIRIARWDGTHFDVSSPVLSLPSRARGTALPSLVSGDVNGDEVADLGLLWGDAVFLYPAVLRP